MYGLILTLLPKVPSGGAAAGGGSAPAAASSGAAPVEEPKEEKAEEKVGSFMIDPFRRANLLGLQEESDDDMGFGLFD